MQISGSWWKIAFAQLLLFPWIISAIELDPANDFRLWIDPRCSDGTAEAFNEARTVASRLREALNANDVPKWLDDAVNRWFGFGTDSPYLEKLSSTLQRIASLHRVNDFNLARYAIYCDNQEGPGWSLSDETTAFHEPSAIVAPVSELPCRDGSASACTFNNFPNVWEERLERLPAVNGHESSVFVCKDALEAETHTVRDLAEGDLENKPVLYEYTLFKVIFHELCHIFELSTLALDFGQASNNPQWGKDMHRIYEGGVLRETRDGYFDRKPGDGGRVKACGETLQLPEFTLYNPDSFANLAQEYWMYLHTWATVELTGNLWYQRWPESEDDTPEPPQYWPTNQGADWSDKATPMEFLPYTLVAGAARRAKRDGGNESASADSYSGVGNPPRIRHAHAHHHGDLGSHGHAHMHKL